MRLVNDWDLRTWGIAALIAAAAGLAAARLWTKTARALRSRALASLGYREGTAAEVGLRIHVARWRLESALRHLQREGFADAYIDEGPPWNRGRRVVFRISNEGRVELARQQVGA